MKIEIGKKYRVNRVDDHDIEVGVKENDIFIPEQLNSGRDLWIGKILGKAGNYYMDESQLSEIVESKIVITIEGNKTIAKLYNDKKVVATSFAKCSGEEEFDIVIGAQIALQRLAKDIGSKIVYPIEKNAEINRL